MKKGGRKVKKCHFCKEKEKTKDSYGYKSSNLTELKAPGHASEVFGYICDSCLKDDSKHIVKALEGSEELAARLDNDIMMYKLLLSVKLSYWEEKRKREEKEYYGYNPAYVSRVGNFNQDSISLEKIRELITRIWSPGKD